MLRGQAGRSGKALVIRGNCPEAGTTIELRGRQGNAGAAVGEKILGAILPSLLPASDPSFLERYGAG